MLAARRITVYSIPSGRKKPPFMCTRNIAPSIVNAVPSAASRVKRPATSAIPPMSSTDAMKGAMNEAIGIPP